MIPLLRRDLDGRYPDWRRTVLICAIAGVLLGSSIGALARVVLVETGVGAGEKRIGTVMLAAMLVALAHVLVVAVDAVRPVPGLLRLLDTGGRVAVWAATLACGVTLLLQATDSSFLGSAVLLVALGGLWWTRGIGRAARARAQDEVLRARIEQHLLESAHLHGLEASVEALSVRLGEWEVRRRRRPEHERHPWEDTGVTRALGHLGPPGRGVRRALDWLGGRGRRS
ncbi:hypothetical protein BF93_12105 [Brachybacterium phenoliresistens]|uniref:Uncharacterized protein n=1 Tax=Brachybacterium phenoliresistens TaxID=396014 RepID=Z9JXF3_9MICO|nr:hypothetical protein [Brachybacterium phenoliresistens]EWS82476.1 hypothetical protein BF93_12105 [Brachybacterium phenoliresistens]